MAEIRVKETGTIKLFESDNTSSVPIASPASLGADRTITLPDASVTLASGTMLATDGSGASLTALNASELGSGTVPTARLGSGTASSSVFLRGDSSWVAAGGVNTPSFVAWADAEQAAADSTHTFVDFESEQFDIGTKYDTTTSTWTPAEVGYYVIGVKLAWSGVFSCDRVILQIAKNDTAMINKIQAPKDGGTGKWQQYQLYMLDYSTSTSDTYRIKVFQDSGGSENIYGTADYGSADASRFWGFKLIV